MWTKQQTVTETPAAPPVQTAASPVVPFGAPSTPRHSSPVVRNLARLRAGLQIKGHITGTEDLQIDRKIEGPTTLRGHQLTGGSTAARNSDIEPGQVTL